MKLIHLADLHFGKNIFGVSLVDEDQAVWVERFLKLVDDEKTQVVMIAGDVYDRSAPSAEAVLLMDKLLTGLVEREVHVMMIAGNHDSGEKLSFASRLLEKQKLYIAGLASKEMMHVTLEDEYGPVTFWLMPYIFPALAAHALGDDTIHDYDAAVRKMIAAQNIDFGERNVMIAHQNVLARGVETIRGGSETMIGGVGEIDYTAFDGFNYVALGHIHAAQQVGRCEVRYAGSPMCYHFSETRQEKKGPLVIELGEKGEVPEIRLCRIPPVHPMREVRGTFQEILEAERDVFARDEYIRVVLNENQIKPEMRDALVALFTSRGSRMLELVLAADRDDAALSANRETYREKSLNELFEEYYRERTATELNEDEREIVKYLAEYASDVNKPEIPDENAVNAFIQYISELGGN